MAAINPRSLFDKLNQLCRRALEAAAGLCLSRTHYHVEIEHLLVKILEQENCDITHILRHYGLDVSRVKRELNNSLDQFKTGNGRAPDLSLEILDLIKESWTLASLSYNAGNIRSGYLLTALLNDRNLSRRVQYSSAELSKINAEALQKDVRDILDRSASEENSMSGPSLMSAGGGAGTPNLGQPGAGAGTPSLDQFTSNLTERAAKGEIDPVIGRDGEIRQVINILMGRRQNNPILTGEAGVGKTAVVEGLALRIASGDVPEPLKNVMLRVLDLALLQAGAGVKGEFENRLKSVIAEVKSSPRPVILFIDEAHTMIGAGGQQGQGDAANLLKPALARGELRTIAATTFSEYKKYFATDAALSRRFQVVKVDEPDATKAVRMLRGLLPMLEKHHKVRVLEEALNDAVRLTTRYIPDRQLPDKAVSLLDKVCARVALSQSTTPPTLEDARREKDHLEAEIRFLERDSVTGADHEERLADLRKWKTTVEANLVQLDKQLEEEKKVVAKVAELRSKLENLSDEKSETDTRPMRDELSKLLKELGKIQGELPLVYPVVDGAAVAELVSSLTGIPLGKMVRNELDTVLNLKSKLAERVVGQDHGLQAIAQRIATARADLVDPRRPFGVFLLVGPSGVGKTETAMALADILYGGDQSMVVINMSEYKESSKVSRLTGTAKGYVGYGEGGVLTNAVKNRPYCVVLLDEIEKADESVQEIFYQVFDKGTLQNDDGEEVNFKNTLVLLTSNAGTDVIMKLSDRGKKLPSLEQMTEAMRPALLKSFKPALLGRMTIVPYYPLAEEVIRKIIILQLEKIKDRLQLNHKAVLTYDPKVVDVILSRCTDVDSGARNVDHIITGTLLPTISTELLTRMVEGKQTKIIKLGLKENGEFGFEFE